MPIVTTADQIAELRERLPELPAAKRSRLKAAWGFSDEEFRDIVNAGLIDTIEETEKAGADASAARKWWMGEISRIANEADKDVTEVGITPAHVVEIEKLIGEKKINNKIARQVLTHVADGEGTPGEIVEKRGLAVVSDDGALTEAVEQAMADNPDVVEKIKAGNQKVIGALMGPIMKATRGQADPGRVREIILEKIN